MSSKKLAKALKRGGSSKAIVKAAKKQGEKESGLGKTGHKFIQAIGNLAAGVATKNFGRVKLPFVNARVAPDEALAVVGGIGYFGRKMLGVSEGRSKWFEDAMWSGVNAMVGRFTWNDSITVINTKDGKIEVKNVDKTTREEPAPSAPPRDIHATIDVDPETGRPRSVSVDARAA